MSGSGAPATQGHTSLRKAWRTVCSVRIGVVLLTAVLLLSLVSTILPQITPDVQADQAAEDQWWAGVQERYGPLTGILHTTGAFLVPSSPLFVLLVAALLANGTACTVARFGPVWRAVKTRPKVIRPDSFYSKAASRAALPIVSRNEGRRKASSVLERFGYRVRSEDHQDASYLVAEKNRLARLGTLVTHCALVSLAVGALLSARLSWRQPTVVLGPGDVYTVGHGTDFEVRHERFEIDRRDDGTIRNYLSHLTVLEDGRDITKKTISVNAPLIYDGVGFYLSSSGPALRLAAWDDQGDAVAIQSESGHEDASGEMVFNFTGADVERTVHLPSMDLRLDLTLLERTTSTEASDHRAFLSLDAFQGDQSAPLISAQLSSGQAVQLPSGTVQVFADSYSVLQVASDPGFLPVVLSGLVGVLGLLISFLFRPSRVWVKVTDSEVVVASPAAESKRAWGAQFAELVHALEGERE